MEAAEAKVLKVLEGSKQFLVPHYQRPYSWSTPQWQVLWTDILELLEDEDPKPHFLGSIVTSPARSVPEGVEKRLVIDGQQRLTTLLLLLTAIRDRARESNAKLADKVQDIITNRHEDGLEFFKLLPTQAEDPAESDRDVFVRLLSSELGGASSRSSVAAAYDWFAKKLRRADAPNLENLHRIVTSKLTLVSIILDEKDNPHRIFESLNGKRRPLSQADLIRNYFFMRLPQGEHEAVYRDLWRPMQRRLGEDALTDFMRHYLTRFAGVVKETDVYAALKARVDSDSTRSPVEHLRELTRYSQYYEVLLAPEKAQSPGVRERLERINRLEVTVAYPFLLPLYADLASNAVDEPSFKAVLDTIENFMLRRFVCGVPTHGLNKVFAPLYEQARREQDFTAAVRRLLSASNRAYPTDHDFRTHLVSARLYGAGERREKTKYILERLEAANGHKETVVTTTLTIEHVMPQSLTEVWQQELGPDWDEEHQQLLHTLGNLTLTSYNAELSNLPFQEKRQRYAASHVELNRYFATTERWNADAIEQRAQALADIALTTWPYFGPEAAPAGLEFDDDVNVAGTVPLSLRFRDVEQRVQSWVDVAVLTMEGISKIGDEEFARVSDELPKFVNRDPTAFRRSSRLRKLSNDAYVETNLSATAIYRLCLQATELAGLVPADWSVTYRAAGADPEDEEEERVTTSTLRQLQHEFWTATRSALERTNTFPSLRPAPARHRFGVPLGRTGCRMALFVNTTKSCVGVKVVLTGEHNEQDYQMLLAQQETIEAEVGCRLEWQSSPDKRLKAVRLASPFHLDERPTWPDAVSWLAEHAAKIYRAFAPRVVNGSVT